MALRDLAKAHLESLGGGYARVCPDRTFLGVVRTGQTKAEPIRPDKLDNPDASDKSDKTMMPQKQKQMPGEADRRNMITRRQGSTDRYCRCGALAGLAWPLDGRREVWRCPDCAPVAGRA
jgi:hypothetical protein